jgi:hypothetical protein
MTSFAESPSHARSTVLPGPTLIAIGLALLIAAAMWPVAPATTGFSLVTLGATGALINRLRASRVLPTAMAAHLLVYVSLYLLFVGAVTHAAMNGPRDGLSFLQGLDFGVSAGLMAMAARVGLATLVRSGDAPAR